jgi:hypothetical protein
MNVYNCSRILSCSFSIFDTRETLTLHVTKRPLIANKSHHHIQSEQSNNIVMRWVPECMVIVMRSLVGNEGLSRQMVSIGWDKLTYLIVGKVRSMLIHI